MKTFKLILKSLISNNSCIDGGRKKPWFFATIMFFLATIFSILPRFVHSLNTNGDDSFESRTYGLDVAALQFDNYLNNAGYTLVVKTSASGEKFIASEDPAGQPIEFDYKHPANGEEGGTPDFVFFYRTTFNANDYKDLVGETGASYVQITQDQIYIYLAPANTPINCMKAAKYLDEGTTINELLCTEGTKTEQLNKTFDNWKAFIKKSYNHSRLTGVWQQTLLATGINVVITVFMGFMVWILTRGKNNPYKLFNLWETQKIAWWASITPALLTLAFGFLVPRFDIVVFPMLIGIRIMWLSMKSLRPDGSGYAESN